MIAVTRLDGGPMVINTDLIEMIEPTPDTLISMSNGDKLYVRESLAEVIELVVHFKRRLRSIVDSGDRSVVAPNLSSANQDEPCQ